MGQSNGDGLASAVNGTDGAGSAQTNRADSEPVFNPIRIDEQKCVRCDLCDWICPGDLIYHAEGDKTKLPVVAYPDECWYCGLCQSICPTQAIEVIFPQRMLHNRTEVVELLGKVEEPAKAFVA
jgi:NAD-dependent dihydropyrimidine dehydrogenase PreA subunit